MERGIKIRNDSVVLNINPKLYSLESIYSAAYVFLDRAYILLDGTPEKKIIIKLKPKEQEDLNALGGEFLNELINYLDYQKRAEQTKKIKEVLLQRALITNDPSVLQKDVVEEDKEFKRLMDELENEDILDDPEGIAVPWEEKYGDKAKKKRNETKVE